MILDVVGDLFADVCQLKEFLLDDGIFGLFGKLSIHGRLLPQIVVPLHTYLPRKDLSSLAFLYNRIMTYGPKTDGTYVVEFRMADGKALAISVPAGETRVL
jgi:hypothetical protein